MEQRANFDNWSKKGAQPLEQVANARWKKILQDYKEPSMEDSAGKALEKYMEKVRASIAL